MQNGLEGNQGEKRSMGRLSKFFAALLFLFTAHCFAADVSVSADDLQKILKEKGLVVVDFGAPWCRHCNELQPVVETQAGVYAKDAKIVRLNTDNAEALTKTLKISSIPTLVVYWDGKEVRRQVGMDADDFPKWIKDRVNAYKNWVAKGKPKQ
jgi:thioredoxin 1